MNRSVRIISGTGITGGNTKKHIENWKEAVTYLVHMQVIPANNTVVCKQP